MARLLAIVVLPSIGLALVTTNTLGRFPFSLEKRIDVSSERKDSATGPGLRCQDMSSTHSAANLPSLEEVTDTGGAPPFEWVPFAGAWFRESPCALPGNIRLFGR